MYKIWCNGYYNLWSRNKNGVQDTSFYISGSKNLDIYSIISWRYQRIENMQKWMYILLKSFYWVDMY